MTIVAGYAQGDGVTGGVQLGAMFAESLRTDLLIATVVPPPWTTPSLARVDAEFAAWTDHVAGVAESEVDDAMRIYPPQLRWAFRRLDHRTPAAGLTACAVESGAEILVLGSSGDGQLGQIVLGSSAEWLLHRSPVPVALSPRGYRSPADGRLRRVTVAYAGGHDDSVIARARALSDRMDAPLRVVTFAVRAGAMYPPLVGLGTEDDVLEQWRSQSEASQADLIAADAVPTGTDCVVSVGRGWREAVDSVGWIDGEVLFLGSSRESRLTQVFVGSRSTKLIRHSPVPVVVLPR